MKKKENIKIIKLGGSLLTDKNKPFSLRKDIIKKSILQIIESNEKIILIHGGGSFGHPVAKKYRIFDGFNPKIKDQLIGLSKTQKTMNEFNSFIINEFLDNNCPAIPVQPSSIFIKDGGKIIIKSIDIIEFLLQLNIIPILYGDIIIDLQNSFSIISGDQIIVSLCNNIHKYKIDKIIFAIEKDGIFIENEKDKQNPKLLKEITFSEILSINLANLDDKIDVTGGIKGKLDEIKRIHQFKIPVHIINGLKNENILKSLKNEEIISSIIK